MPANIITLPVGKLAAAIRSAIAMNEVLVILGPPGVGKTQITKQVAEEDGYIYCELLLAGRDIGDFMMPFVVNGEKPHLTFHYNPELPIEGSKFPTDKLIVLNIDEWSNASKLMQNLMLKVLDERKLGEAKLLPNVRIIATGNRAWDMAHTEPLSAPLSNRATFVTVEPDKQAFIIHAMKRGMHPIMLAWVDFDDDHLFSFDRSQHLAGDHAFPSPRSNERLSKLLHYDDAHPMDRQVFENMACGNIGQAKGIKFNAFRDMKNRMPDLNDICRKGTGFIPPEPPVLFATITALAQRANPSNLGNVLKYLSTLPEEWHEQIASLFPKVKGKEIIETYVWGEFMSKVTNARNALSNAAANGDTPF